MSATELLGEIAKLIINPLIVLSFVIATIFLFYGIAELIWKSDSSDLEKSKKNVKYGIIGMFIMFSVFGILRLILSTLKIDCEGIFFC